MRTVLNMLNAAKGLQLQAMEQQAMNKSAPQLVDLQKDQLFDGIRSDGKDITPPYSPLTVSIKKGKGQPTDHVTLKDEGNFYNGIYAEPGSDGLMIDSRDSKSNMLQEKYGDQIFGLSNRLLRRTEWLENVRGNFMQDIEKTLQ